MTMFCLWSRTYRYCFCLEKCADKLYERFDRHPGTWIVVLHGRSGCEFLRGGSAIHRKSQRRYVSVRSMFGDINSVARRHPEHTPVGHIMVFSFLQEKGDVAYTTCLYTQVYFVNSKGDNLYRVESLTEYLYPMLRSRLFSLYCFRRIHHQGGGRLAFTMPPPQPR